MEFEGFNEYVRSLKRHLTTNAREIFTGKVCRMVLDDEKKYGFRNLFYWTFKKIMDEFEGEDLDTTCETWVTIMRSLWFDDSPKAMVENRNKDILLVQVGLSEFGMDGVRVGVCYSYALVKFGEFSSLEETSSFRNEVCDSLARTTAGMRLFQELFDDKKVSDMLSEMPLSRYMKGFSEFFEWYDSRGTGDNSLQTVVAADIVKDIEEFDVYAYLNSSVEYMQSDKGRILCWIKLIAVLLNVTYSDDKKSYMYWKFREALSKMLVGADYPSQTVNGCQVLQAIMVMYLKGDLDNPNMFNMKTLAMKARKGIVRNESSLSDDLIIDTDDGFIDCGI